MASEAQLKNKHTLPLSFFAVMFLYHFSSGFAHPVTPTLVVDRGLPSQWYGYAMSAVSVGCFVIAPFWGKLCNYISTKKIAIIGMAGYAVGQFIMMNAYSGIQLLIGRVFAGLLSMGPTVAMINYIINVGSERERPRYLTIYATSGSVSNAAGYFAGGLLGIKGIEVPFIVQMGVLAVACVLAFFVLEDDTPYKHRPERGINIKEVNPFSAFLDAKNYMTPILALFFAAFLLYNLGMSLFETVFNYYIKDHFGLGSQYNGTIKAVIAVSSLTMNFTVGMWVVKKTDIHRSYFVLTVITAAVVGCALLFFESMLPLFAAFILYSILSIMVRPLGQNICAEHATEENSNSLMGFFQAMSSFSHIIGSFSEARLYLISIRLPFYCAFAVMLISVFTSFVYVTRHSREKAARG